MKKPFDTRLGIMFRREHAPEMLHEFTRRTEAAGFDELWVVEDCFYGSGVAAAATALAASDEITVGLGIMPAVVRNPVFAAMEIATLARLYPGRFLPGLGHGVGEWMRQIGAFPESQLLALEEVALAIRALLRGEILDYVGSYVHVEDARLVHPPLEAPPISLGVVGPKSLALSGRAADGTILSEYAAPAYVAWAKERIAAGMRAAGNEGPHRLTVFAFACADDGAGQARRRLRPMVAEAMASGGIDAKLTGMGVLAQVKDYLHEGGQATLEAHMPDEWIDQLAIAGSPGEWRAAIERLAAQGVDSIVLAPLPDAPLEEVEVFARQLEAALDT